MTTDRNFGPHHDEIIAMATLLKETWDKVDPNSNVSKYPASYWETFLDMAKAVVADRYKPTEHGKPEKLRIYINRKITKVATTNKIAAHAVHAALEAFGVHPGVKVVVLDKGPTEIEKMRVAIHDAGHTELEPGTLTAGTNWPEDSDEN